MKIASWNVNSLRVRLQHVIDWIENNKPDVLGLQETKLADHDFPADAFFDMGYDVRFAGQKTYNGVAFLSRQDTTSPEQLLTRFDGYEDSQKRIIAATFGDVRVYNLYIPNGQAVGSDKYNYKLQWLDALRGQMEKERARYDKLVVMGDFNIAPEDRDIHDPDLWRGKIMCSEAERQKLAAITSLGISDLFRQFEQDAGSFSWWDYRMGGYNQNNGLRIDLILATDAVAAHCVKCDVDRAPRELERPSDHAPVWAQFEFKT